MSDEVVESGVAVADDLLSTPQRQSPMGLVFEAINVIRNLQGFNFAVLAAFVFARQFGPFLIGAVVVGLLAIVAWSALSWWKFVFCVNGEQLVVQRGVFADERLAIPLVRIQSISIEQPALHRLFGLVKVGVETAGTSAVEFEIEAVSSSVAQALRQVADSYGARLGATAEAEMPDVDASQAETPAAAAEVLVARSSGELVKAAMSRLPLAGVVGLGSLFPFMDQIVSRVDSLNLDSSPTRLAGVVFVVALFLWIVNILQEVVRNWGLTVTRSRAGLLRTSGMFSRTERSTTIERVQAVRTIENVAERRLGIRRVVLPTIGSGDIHVTGATAEELARLRELAVGARAVTVADRPVSPWLVYYELRAIPLILIGLGVGAAISGSPLVWVGLLAVLWVCGKAVVRWKFFRWTVEGGRVIVSQTLVTRRSVEQRLVTVQTVTLQRTWLERRRNLATLVLASAENQIVIPMIELREAKQLRDLLVATLAVDRRPWM